MSQKCRPCHSLRFVRTHFVAHSNSPLESNRSTRKEGPMVFSLRVVRSPHRATHPTTNEIKQIKTHNILEIKTLFRLKTTPLHAKAIDQKRNSIQRSCQEAPNKSQIINRHKNRMLHESHCPLNLKTFPPRLDSTDKPSCDKDSTLPTGSEFKVLVSRKTGKPPQKWKRKKTECIVMMSGRRFRWIRHYF